MQDILKDLKSLIEKHESKSNEEIIRWVPICLDYKFGTFFNLEKQMGGSHIRRGKEGIPVLVWLKIQINPERSPEFIILESVKP